MTTSWYGVWPRSLNEPLRGKLERALLFRAMVAGLRPEEKEAASAERRSLQERARRGAARGGRAGRSLEDRNREQLYELAKKRTSRGRSKMGKWDLIEALRRSQ